MLETKEKNENNKKIINQKKNVVVRIVKSKKAITLIALVITIIVIIILASIAIYLSLGNNGIFTKAKEAKEMTNKQTATDIINLKITTAQMNKYANEQRMPTLKELSEILKADGEIAYVTETSQVASTKYEVGENPSSIYTKLYEYPYEFEINSSLQLASIDGIKIANNNNNQVIIENNYLVNENCIDKENSHIDIVKYGKIVSIAFVLKMKTDIPSSSAMDLITNLPIPATKRYTIIGRESGGYTVNMCLEEGKIKLWYDGRTLNNGTELNGSVTYIEK